MQPFHMKNESEVRMREAPAKKERNFPHLDLTDQSTLSAQSNQPVLVIQSPKTPTLSRKLKAVSLDSDPPKQTNNLDVSRDVFSMPNTPKKQINRKCDFDETQKFNLAPTFTSNLMRFSSNTSISGSQTLKTLPEVMTLQDFSDNRTEPIRIKTKGLLERRGSNASLTIDLGSNSNLAEIKTPISRLNPAKSVSNLNLMSFGADRCLCEKKDVQQPTNEKKATGKDFDRRKSQTFVEKCANCTIYESEPSKIEMCKNKCQNFNKKCSCLCNYKCRRKSLSNENLYVPPCHFCKSDGEKDCVSSAKGHRKACYPRQADLEASQLLSEDFKLHLQNVQYLQTAGSVLSIADLKALCEVSRVPKLHLEFWEVPLNLQEKCLVSGSQSRNRYRDVLPNEHSRVHLPGLQTYIHANYIKGPDYTEPAYIATQGPMAHTCEDFWEMIWTNKCNCIVMLTDLVEKGRNKCELYFPLGKKETTQEKSYFLVKTSKIQDKFTFESRLAPQCEEEIVKFEELNVVRHGKYQIEYVEEETLPECVMRHFEVKRKIDDKTDNRKIKHFWFSNWQDHKMANPQQVLDLALRVVEVIDRNKIDKVGGARKPDCVKASHLQSNMEGLSVNKHRKNQRDDLKTMKKKSPDSSHVPVVVHCSAGIGRTGCFLAILNGIQQLRSNFNVDVLAILCSLRLHRGGMVQTAEQYELIHKVLSLYTEQLC